MAGQATPVYHGEHGVRTLKELSRSYLTLPLPRNGAKELLLMCYACGTPRRYLYGWEALVHTPAALRLLTGCVDAARGFGTPLRVDTFVRASCFGRLGISHVQSHSGRILQLD